MTVPVSFGMGSVVSSGAAASATVVSAVDSVCILDKVSDGFTAAPVRKPAREPHLHGVLAACLRSFSRTLTADSRIKSIDRGNIIWYHIHALAVTEDSATVRTDTSAVNGVGGKSDAMR